MKKLILSLFLLMATNAFARELHHFSEVKKALTKGKSIRIAVNFVQCLSSKKPSAFHIGLFSPNEIQIMQGRIAASLTHFTLDNPKFPNTPVYEFVKYLFTQDDNLALSSQVLDARNYSVLSDKFSMNCKIGEGVTVYV